MQEDCAQNMLCRKYCTGNAVQEVLHRKILYIQYCTGKCCTGKDSTDNVVRIYYTGEWCKRKSWWSNWKKTKKRAPKKTTAKKATATKKPAAKKVATKKTVEVKKVVVTKVDEKNDLKVIKGIGPVLEETLNSLNITTYSQIAKMTIKNLTSLLNDAGVNAKIYDLSSWKSQAKTALTAKKEEEKS